MKKIILILFILNLLVLPSLSIVKADNSQVMVNYDLPYAGVLPDNFLYKLKTFRDAVISFLISDPLKKAEFDLLQADKRLAAGLALSQENMLSENLIIDTISKGENYFSNGIRQLDFARKQGENTSDLTSKFLLSSKKHIEVENIIMKKISVSAGARLEKEELRMSEFQKSFKNSPQN